MQKQKFSQKHSQHTSLAACCTMLPTSAVRRSVYRRRKNHFACSPDSVSSSQIRGKQLFYPAHQQRYTHSHADHQHLRAADRVCPGWVGRCGASTSFVKTVSQHLHLSDMLLLDLRKELTTKNLPLIITFSKRQAGGQDRVNLWATDATVEMVIYLNLVSGLEYGGIVPSAVFPMVCSNYY